MERFTIFAENSSITFVQDARHITCAGMYTYNSSGGLPTVFAHILGREDSAAHRCQAYYPEGMIPTIQRWPPTVFAHILGRKIQRLTACLQYAELCQEGSRVNDHDTYILLLPGPGCQVYYLCRDTYNSSGGLPKKCLPTFWEGKYSAAHSVFTVLRVIVFREGFTLMITGPYFVASVQDARNILRAGMYTYNSSGGLPTGILPVQECILTIPAVVYPQCLPTFWEGRIQRLTVCLQYAELCLGKVPR
ncbi:hypothetical protein J6590_007671 [Homalodisca vitripennis]|nr:hypothetical protein J6590_007671 [Homalodisca vitripennis]